MKILTEIEDLSKIKIAQKKHKYAEANEYLRVFNRVHRQVCGKPHYVDYGLDNAVLKDVIGILKKNHADIEQYFIWVCTNHESKIRKHGLKILRFFINDFIDFKVRNEF